MNGDIGLACSRSSLNAIKGGACVNASENERHSRVRPSSYLEDEPTPVMGQCATARQDASERHMHMAFPSHGVT